MLKPKRKQLIKQSILCADCCWPLV